MAFATATPIAMIVPMKLSRFRVVPVSRSMSTEPARTAGAVESTTKASFKDWKFAVSKQKDHANSGKQANAEFAKDLLHRAYLPAY